MIELQRPRLPSWRPDPIVIITKAPPFAESRSGNYTHRVRSAIIHTNDGHWSHMAAHMWCGMGMLFDTRKHAGNRFVDEPSAGRPVCATCEGRAIGAGQDGAMKIAGRMVKFSPRLTNSSAAA